ncbi:acetyl-CoA carboxylase biotin carboxylase subunit family protein [Ramlibacter sp.]|uniref:ATP-grasp domain-containing protein n=1 Tax=Ramlibacter sp. TaxID=1917967 RepID=UPI0035AD8CA2
MTWDAERRSLVLFNHDWDREAFARLAPHWPHESAGFDLFSFPSNARLAWFDMDRFANACVRRIRRRDLHGVVSNHEQFGALAAALVAERMGWPGTPVQAVLACQHKLHARTVLAEVCPEANLPFSRLDAAYGGPVPQGLAYPQFVKPVKAAFSVLAREVHSQAELHTHTRFGAWELWVIRHLVEPFERIARQRLPQAGTAHALMLEQPVSGPQYCLDGYVLDGRMHTLGVVDVRMYPGTQAFQGFDYPSRLAPAVQARAADIARRFLKAIGFTHGLFNMEFFHDPATDRLTVLEFNPRLASQFSDLYRRVDGIDLHAYAFALAHGIDPATLPRHAPTAGVASSFVYRLFDVHRRVAMPDRLQRQVLQQAYPDALLLLFPKDAGSITRDYKWLGSYRYGILHLGGADWADLLRRCEVASTLLGWPAPLESLQELVAAPADPSTRMTPQQETP